MMPRLPLFKSLIKERCGLLCEGNSEETLAQALSERSQALHIQPADYYARLSSDEAEFQELVNLLTINETYFFREPEQIRLLVDRLAPRFLAAHGGRVPVRILSAGCSSGEEPYSLAMALLDKYGDSVSRLFSFVGGDIDSTVLAKARNGRYTDFSFRGVPAEVRNRYFDKDRWGNLLKPAVKALVSFHELNLLADSFPATLRDFDIIFFRNVSIYFDAPTRQIIQRNLASLMKDDGVLVIGTAETLANDLGVLPLFEENGLFYFIKGTPPLPEIAAPASTAFTPSAPVARPAFTFPPPAQSPSPAPWPVPPLTGVPPSPPAPSSAMPPPAPPAPPPVDLAAIRQWVRDKHYEQALPALNALLAVDHKNIEIFLFKAHVLLERRDFAGAGQLAQQALAIDNWSVDAFLLLGLAAKWQQQHAEAIRWFKQAAYVRHECWPAHYYLADAHRHSGNSELAQRAYRVVIQLLSGGEPDTGIKHLPLSLRPGEIRFLCEHQLAKLPTGKSAAGQG